METGRITFSNWQPPTIIHNVPTKYGWQVSYPEGLVLGFMTDIGAFTYIQARCGVIIGDDVQIGSHVSIYSESTIDGKKGRVEIGKGAKIGTHSTVMPGVKIGEYATVGAHSLVNRNIPEGETWFGVPAKPKKYWGLGK